MKNIDGLSIYEAESKIREYLRELYVSKPKEPLLKSLKPTEEEVSNFLAEKEKYKTDLEDYKTKDEFYRKESSRLYSLLEYKIKEDSGLNNIPEQYRDKVYSYAYQQGHGSGYGEVYNYLLDLVEIFD
jgi:hypothetical protein